MIIKLKGADFSLNNINSLLNSWLISISGRNYVTVSSNISSVDKNGSYVNTFTVKENYEVSNVVVTMGGVTQSGVVDVTSGAAGTKITINISQVTGAVNIVFTGSYVGTGDEPEPEEPTGPIAYYVVNKNIWSDGEITDSSGLGRIAITTYFPTDGKELRVSTSIAEATTIAKRYYDANKTGGVAAADSVYGRPVLVFGTTALEDIYAGETITVNGTVYTLQVDPEYGPKHVTYVTKANIGADGNVQENYGEFRVAVLDYFETGGAAITASSSLGDVAIRYYDADKKGGATATTSTYARCVIHSIPEDKQNDAAVEGSRLVINDTSYTLSNN